MPKLRAMLESDLIEIIRMEAVANPVPWSKLDFAMALQSNQVGLVIEGIHGNVMAYLVGQIEGFIGHIYNVLVNPEFVRQGLGSQLMKHFIELARIAHCSEVWLEVRAGNDVAIKFYEHWCFAKVTVRKKYYYLHTVRKFEDACLMTKIL
ncbi:MAG: ribosomal protein S18-alanine N-acetyltransferase [Gammaproteobacteria bacterium]|nr:ribosomal protein S18-alanine N-acetyltransferase [Gammaproteobacteria bacterium]